MRVEILSHPQTVAIASHHFTKPTASPSSRFRWCTVEHGGWGSLILASCTLERCQSSCISLFGHVAILKSLLLGDWCSQQIELWRAA